MTLKTYLKKYPISLLFITAIWVFSFIDVPETPLDDVSLIDKWAHTAMYGVTCGMVWLEYLLKHKKILPWRLFVFAFIAPIFMGGVIELLQEYCTGGRRTGDLLDFAANTLGITLAAGAGTLSAWYRAKHYKACA